MRMTMEQVAAHQAKHAPKRAGKGQQAVASDEAGQEAGLHREILQWCASNHCPVIHSPMHRKSSQTPGSPDFTIVLKNGHVLFAECKTKAGKLSEEQIVWHHLAYRNGKTVYIVRSMAEFLGIVRDLTE